MTLYVGSNKIKDVYVGSQNTNVITSVPKNINLTLSNGTLTLKAGSKVYVPNGKNADGSNKFDEVTIASDKTRELYGDYNDLAYFRDDGIVDSRRKSNMFFSGTVAPTGEQYMTWYDTANNLIKYTNDGGSIWYSGCSFPFAEITATSNGGITSIDQIFDWCGYIGSTAFVLPGVKGLIPNGFKADGTYNVIEWTSNGVITKTLAYGAQNYYWGVQDGNQALDFYGKTITYYDNKTNTIVDTYPDPDVTRYGWMFLGECVGDSSNKITSLTPYTAQPSTTTIPINAIYNGSQLVYDNKFKQPVLTANGTLGGNSFAVTGKSVYSGDYWNAFDNNTSTIWHSNGGMPQWLTMYNPKALKLKKLKITTSNSSEHKGVTAGTVLGSNDNATWEHICDWTNNVTGQGATWEIVVNSQKYYKYHQLNITKTAYNPWLGACAVIAEIKMDAIK